MSTVNENTTDLPEFGNRVAEYVPALKRYALALTRNKAAADDLLQETVLRALSKKHLFRDGTNLRAWLSTILHNIYINDKRKSSRRIEVNDPEKEFRKLYSLPRQYDTVLLGNVGARLRKLPATQQAAITSIAIEGKTYEEAARELDVPAGTIKSRCNRARKALAAEFDAVQAKNGRQTAIAGAAL